jgi:hypothetical protein
MAEPKDPILEAEERLQTIRERRKVIEALPEGDMRSRMLVANNESIRKAQTRVDVMRGGPTETMWDRATRGVGDWLNEKLMIEESFADSLQTGLPESEGGMGRTDRARHLLWTSKLAERYGPAAAMAITTLKEGENLITDPFKALSRLGNNRDSTDSIREHQFDSLKETGRDFQTNLWAVRNAPRNPDGSIRAFTPEEAADIAGKLETTPSPLNQRQIAEVPRGVLRDDREVTTTRYPETPAEPVGEPQGGTIKYGPIQRVEPTPEDVLRSTPMPTAEDHFREALNPPAIEDRPPGDPKWRGRQATTGGFGTGPSQPVSEKLTRRMYRRDI